MPAIIPNNSSVAIDSISAPSQDAQYYAPQYTNAFPDSTGNNFQRIPIAKLPIMEVPTGKAEMNYIDTPIKSGGSILLILLSFLFVAFSFRKGSKYFSMLLQNLFTIKKQRQNMFDDHTVNESQMLTSLIFNTCVICGLFLFATISIYYPEIVISNRIFYSVLACIAVAFLLYLFQLVIYYTLGYVFDDKYGLRLWIEGYNAQISILGVILMPVILALLLYPNYNEFILKSALFIYLLVRIVFICKGFRIFFNNMTSIPYFILYLCNVEIVPLILSYAGAIVLCKLIAS